VKYLDIFFALTHEGVQLFAYIRYTLL